MAYVNCIAGAITKEEYEFILNAAGLTSMSSMIKFFFDFLSLFNKRCPHHG